MSSIYIPDVGLPKDGDFELWISIRKDGTYNYNISGGWNEGKRKAVPVPKHGRLIDADALIEKVEYDTPLSAVFEKTIRRYLENAQTIIPADVPDNNVGIIPAEEGE